MRIRSGIHMKIRSAAVIAARSTAIGAIAAALIGGLFLLAQPLAKNFIDEYYNRTSEIRILDVRTARTEGKLTINIVFWNPTLLAQPVVSVEVGLQQKGPLLSEIGKSVYNLAGEVLIEHISGAAKVRGDIQAEDRVIYPVDGVFEIQMRGGWSLLLTIPVRETLAPGESRSILFVVPSKINILAKSSDWFTKWLPFSSSTGGLESKDLGGPGKNEFSVGEFLRKQGSTEMRIRAKRGDGKNAGYHGSITI